MVKRVLPWLSPQLLSRNAHTRSPPAKDAVAVVVGSAAKAAAALV